MATSTVENYVKQLYIAQNRASGQLVQLGKLATALDVVPGTVTTMIRTLADAGLVHYEPRNGCSLTAAGEKLALHVLRRHRLVELFLVKVLGYDWSEVHEEAEELEHVVSEKLLERIDILLGRPSADPHGDPIPNAEGELPHLPTRPLSECASGDQLQIVRVNNQDPQFLKMVDEMGLTPGTRHSLSRNDPVAGTLQLKTSTGESCVVGTKAAESILVCSTTN
jgi:DtxR family Mn-dependent transcriptional regulator